MKKSKYCLLVDGCGIHYYELFNNLEEVKRLAEKSWKEKIVYCVQICEKRIEESGYAVYTTALMKDKRYMDKEWRAPDSFSKGEVFSVWFNYDGTTMIDYSGEMISKEKLEKALANC